MKSLPLIFSSALLLYSIGCFSQTVNIDNGRQLFIDDLLIESTTLERTWHYPQKYEGNPVLVPQTAWECPDPGTRTARPNGGGIWWDDDEQVFKLWYEGGWLNSVCYATSRDGINWERPDLDVVPGTNIVLPLGNPALRPDSWSVVLDPDAKNPDEKYKMALHRPWTSQEAVVDGTCLVSGDGIHWRTVCPLPASGDRSTMYYDPFREKWVFSIRSSWPDPGERWGRRNRSYYELDDFMKGPEWYGGTYADNYDYFRSEAYSVDHWIEADSLDHVDPSVSDFTKTALYCFDAVAYESIMLGMLEIHMGPENHDCDLAGMPKITDLKFAYSRDGRNFMRPDRNNAIASERWPSGKWDAGYVQPVSNLCTIMGDELWFYYGAFAGNPEKHSTPDHTVDWFTEAGMYDNAATGIAKLRRDGFASMDGTGELITTRLQFSGEYLFINADASQGAVSVALLDSAGNVVKGFEAENSRVKKINSTKYRITWRKHDKIDLSKFPEYRLKFVLENAQLYSFWVSMEEGGASNGYLAGGGPGYKTLKDAPAGMRAEVMPVISAPDAYHTMEARHHQGIPSIAASASGRLWATWYCSRTQNEDEYNYLVLATCAKEGESWEEVYFCDPDKDGPRRVFDPEIFISPDGKLRWTWTDRVGTVSSLTYGDQLWMATLDPESGAVVEEPRVIARGVMMNKPSFTDDGLWLMPVAHWWENPSACLYVSSDGGDTFEYRGGVSIPYGKRMFDEHTILEKKDGSLKSYIRVQNYPDNCLWEAESYDGGFTWTVPIPCRAANLCSRTMVTALSNGDWLMVKHGPYSRILPSRSHLIALVSHDEGRTWWGGLELDKRVSCSYPDGVQLPDGSVIVVSDYSRQEEMEISYVRFRPEDVENGEPVPERVIISNYTCD